MSAISLYIHFPYCLYKCHYCDFNSYAVTPDNELFNRYLDALESELHWRVQNEQAFARGSRLQTLFLGGGTPSLLSPKQIERLLTDVAAVYPFVDGCEITVECNPKTLTREKVDAYRAIGVNRLSIGIQSFDDKYLAPLGRIHSGQEAEETLALVAESGFPNVNTDLMFGFPEQTLKEAEDDLQRAVRYGFAHLSYYNLTPEPGTRFYQDLKKGQVTLPDTDLQLAMMRAGRTFLMDRGFCAYEVSNFYRRAGMPSAHNLQYWNYAPFLGLGAGATSFLYAIHPQFSGRRHLNRKSPDLYLRQAGEVACFQEETIAAAVAMKEWLMMGLRKHDGVSLREFSQLFGVEFAQYFSAPLEKTKTLGWVVHSPSERLCVTEQGLWMLDRVIAEFF